MTSGEDNDCDAFDVDVETPGWGDCGKLRASVRNRANSLADKPTGIGATGGESGSIASGDAGEEDRRWSATISASGSPMTRGCCSARIPESWVTSEEFGSKGVTIKCGSAFMESVEYDKIDLGLDRLRLRRRCTKVTHPITKMAAIPPMVPPTIAPASLFRCFGDGKSVVTDAPFAFIVCAGILRCPSQEFEKSDCFALTLKLMGQTQHLVRD